MTITGKTRLTGLFGDPVTHSVSPAIHNTAFKLLNIDMAYVPFHVIPTELENAVNGLRGLNIAGVNVTIPHKQTVLPFLDIITKEAALIGAVNTIVNDQGKLTGYTTDATGFIASTARAGFTITGKHITILGGGGTARSLVAGMVLQTPPASIILLGRTVSRVTKIASDIAACSNVPIIAAELTRPMLETTLKQTDMLVNCTSVGMSPKIGVSPVPAELLHANLVVLDIVYNPLETQLLADARHAGCTTIDGLGMLLFQGIASFKIWTGQEPPFAPLREAAIAALRL